MCLGGIVLYILFALAPTDAEKQAMRHSAEHHNHTYQNETAVATLTKADVLQSSYRFSVIFYSVRRIDDLGTFPTSKSKSFTDHLCSSLF